jgi:uncharacterized repeat protein (TIGR03803 family)
MEYTVRASNCRRCRRPAILGILQAATFLIALLVATGLAAADTQFDILRAFDATALSPAAPLLLGADANFYGTTSQGGAAGAGTIFRLTPAGDLTVLYAFTGGADGGYPYGGLIQSADGSFYGTTSSGGAFGVGTAFQLRSDGTFAVVYSFTAANDGSYPFAGLIQGADGNFYGTASGGGAFGAGTVFQLTPAGIFSVVYSFTGADDGGYPYAGVVQGADGNLYGTTYTGGNAGGGTVFQLTLAGILTVVHGFTGGTDGGYPYGGVIQGSDGNLYGTASQGGASGVGVVLSIDA